MNRPRFDITPFLHQDEGQHFDRKSLFIGPEKLISWRIGGSNLPDRGAAYHGLGGARPGLGGAEHESASRHPGGNRQARRPSRKGTPAGSDPVHLRPSALDDTDGIKPMAQDQVRSPDRKAPDAPRQDRSARKTLSGNADPRGAGLSKDGATNGIAFAIGMR